MWFWFAAGFAYMFLALANCVLARRLRWLPNPNLPEDKELEKEDAQFSQVDIANRPEDWGFGYDDVMRGFKSNKDIVRNFNDSIETNRWVLYLAALSFFIAAGISFVQGAGM
jgi:cyclopropane fatty-acyl-phospholipid synthase-like methyltransferase